MASRQPTPEEIQAAAEALRRQGETNPDPTDARRVAEALIAQDEQRQQRQETQPEPERQWPE